MTPAFERQMFSRSREFSPPRCRECGSAETEPVTTMRRHTCAADEWYRCGECERVFTVSQIGEP
jgi:predicted SprT family Zn-dependent metalloprotease